jgi:hypothetical protein
VFTYTPFGWLLLLGSILALIAIVRSAVVPPLRTPAPKAEHSPGALAAIIFAGLMFGIVRWSWFGIFPSIAASIGVPESFSERLAAALCIGFMAGLIAFIACLMAEGLETIGASLSSHRFARTDPVHP